MVVDALLLWLVVYVGILAATGFILFVVRGFSGRRWSSWTLLRTASTIAFVSAFALWLVVVLAD